MRCPPRLLPYPRRSSKPPGSGSIFGPPKMVPDPILHNGATGTHRSQLNAPVFGSYSPVGG